MIIFLYGQDSYRSQKKLKEIIAQYQTPHKTGLNLKFYNGKTLNFKDFKDEFQQTSMFKEKKLAVLTNVFQNQNFKEEFLKEKKLFKKAEETIVFFEEGKVLQADKLASFLKRNAKTQKFELLSGQKLKNWVKKEAEKYKGSIESDALERLVDFVGSDLWRASNEIKKLATYKPKITKESVELLVKPEIETNIFSTIDAIAEKDKKRALSLLHQHLEKGDHPLYLLKMINNQFRNLLLIKEAAELQTPYSRLAMHPFVVRKSIALARKFSLKELKKIYHKLFEADFNIKTGKLEAEFALDLLIAEI